MLDTSVAIDLRDGDPSWTAEVAALGSLPLLSIVTRVELEGGVYRQPDQARARRARLDTMLAALPVVPFDEAAADGRRSFVAVEPGSTKVSTSWWPRAAQWASPWRRWSGMEISCSACRAVETRR